MKRGSIFLALALGSAIPVFAGSITITPTFDASITGGLDPAAVEAAINAAISGIEADITSPNPLSVSIYFTAGGGLGESFTTEYQTSYFQYYNAFAAVATQPNQLTALASLGPAPGVSTGNPVDGNTNVIVTSAEGRNLGLGTSGVILPNSNIALATGGGTYDAEIALNTSITDPPQPNNGSNYGLQAVANHEIDETLGIGGTGSSLSGTGGSVTGPVGDLDLYRYTCSVTITASLTCPAGDASRSYSDLNITTPYSYFSIDGGLTVLSFFNQTDSSDFGDWLSNPIPTNLGFSPQVQDAFGASGTDPALGVNELASFNAIGYDLVNAAPEPSSLLLFGLALLLAAGTGRRLRKSRQS